MLSCKDFTENANAYLDRDLSLMARFGIVVHSIMCVHCRNYLKQLHTTILTLGKMKKEETVDDATAENIAGALNKNNTNN